MQDHVVEAVVAMDDRGLVIDRAALGQPGDELVHLVDLGRLAGPVLLGPAVDLAGEIVAGLAVVGEAHSRIVDIVQGRQGVDLGLVDRPPLGRLIVGQSAVPKDAALDVLHDVEDRADDVLVHAKRIGLGHREVSLVQARDHLELAIHGMGAGQQLARRLAAQDVLLGRRDQLVGRVGLAALELADLQRAGIALDIGLQPGGQLGLVDRVARVDRLGARVQVLGGLFGGFGHGALLPNACLNGEFRGWGGRRNPKILPPAGEVFAKRTEGKRPA